jgi:hypothetical protein
LNDALLRADDMLWVRALEPIALEYEFSAFCAILPQNLNFSLNDLQNAKTPKLQNALENNKAKGLISVN